jgi:hypothetical protein
MSKSPSVVPDTPLAEELPTIGAEYFLPEALELCRKIKDKTVSELTDDEIVMLALTAGQAALAKYVEPGNRSAEETIEAILGILDHGKVVQATLHKLHTVLRQREKREQHHLQPERPQQKADRLNPYFHP